MFKELLPSYLTKTLWSTLRILGSFIETMQKLHLILQKNKSASLAFKSKLFSTFFLKHAVNFQCYNWFLITSEQEHMDTQRKTYGFHTSFRSLRHQCLHNAMLSTNWAHNARISEIQNYLPSKLSATQLYVG